MKLVDYLSVAGKSIPAFAAEIGVSRQAVYRYCDGVRIPAPNVMARIKAVTKGAVTADDFYAPHGEAA